MSWFSKSFLPTVIGGVGGFLMGGYAGAAVGAGLGAYSGYQTDKTEREQKKAAKKMEEEIFINMKGIFRFVFYNEIGEFTERR